MQIKRRARQYVKLNPNVIYKHLKCISKLGIFIRKHCSYINVISQQYSISMKAGLSY